MKSRNLVRPLLVIVFGLVGALIGRVIFAPGTFLIILGAISFGILGFILPELLEFIGKAGIAALASHIIDNLPKPEDLNPLPKFRFQRKNKNKYANPIVVDTSSLIDGRILDVVRSHFLTGTLLILPSVISELHMLSDSSIDLKRAKGRRGLACLEELGKERDIRLEILKNEPKEEEVDKKVIELARKLRAKILTVDFNLNKVASIRKIAVLNVNELANAVKTVVLPGERLSVQINEIGKGENQGVGYLGDGTMVVVEGGARMRGKTVETTVSKVLQTAAGKMIFARPLP